MTVLECRFDIDNTLALMPSLVNFLQQAGTRMQLFEEPERLHVGVALEEALVNAYYHGNLEVDAQLRADDYRAYYDLARSRSQQPPWRDRRIHVTARATRTEATYVIRDEGRGFNAAAYAPPTEPSDLERPFGRGLLLIHTFMDEVRFNSAGNEVTLVKHKVAPRGRQELENPGQGAHSPIPRGSPADRQPACN
jgi:anti-sigma regulatory factor (Ser/Thr protein kinase)